MITISFNEGMENLSPEKQLEINKLASKISQAIFKAHEDKVDIPPYIMACCFAFDYDITHATKLWAYEDGENGYNMVLISEENYQQKIDNMKKDNKFGEFFLDVLDIVGKYG